MLRVHVVRQVAALAGRVAAIWRRALEGLETQMHGVDVKLHVAGLRGRVVAIGIMTLVGP